MFRPFVLRQSRVERRDASELLVTRIVDICCVFPSHDDLQRTVGGAVEYLVGECSGDRKRKAMCRMYIEELLAAVGPESADREVLETSFLSSVVIGAICVSGSGWSSGVEGRGGDGCAAAARLRLCMCSNRCLILKMMGRVFSRT